MGEGRGEAKKVEQEKRGSESKCVREGERGE